MPHDRPESVLQRNRRDRFDLAIITAMSALTIIAVLYFAGAFRSATG